MNAIYQYWDGNPTPECYASVAAMKEYAERIGAEHIFELDPKFASGLGKYTPHYGQFKVVYDESFDKYDKILFTDTDVFPIENLNENIFDEIGDEDVAIAEEWNQIETRKKHTIAGINNQNDRHWASVVDNAYNITVPRAECGSPRAYNSGVVLWSKQGRKNARATFVDFKTYVHKINLSGLPAFYTCDQPYLHAMMMKLNWKELDYKWNSSVHYTPATKDPRPVTDLRDGANMVHVQLGGVSQFSADKFKRIVNLPVKDWNL